MQSRFHKRFQGVLWCASCLAAEPRVGLARLQKAGVAAPTAGEEAPTIDQATEMMGTWSSDDFEEEEVFVFSQRWDANFRHFNKVSDSDGAHASSRMSSRVRCT